MSDLPLIYELALVAALISLLSWLMGRTLCKSREHEERAAKKALQSANKHLETQLQVKDTEIQQQSVNLQTLQQELSELLQQHSNTEHLLTRAQTDHQHSLTQVQSLNAYQAKFDALEKVHDDQARQTVNLQEALRKAQHDMSKTVAAHESTLRELREEKTNADNLIAEQQSALQALQQKQQAMENEAGKQDALVVQLRKKVGGLQQAATEKDATIEKLKARINEYMVATDSTNQRISGLLNTLSTTD